MTIQASATNNIKQPSKTKAYFFYKLKNMRALTVVSIVFAMCGTPMIALAGSILENSVLTENVTLRSFAYGAMIIGIVGVILSALFGFVICISNFRYLHDRSVVDMNYSLPLTNSQRFWSDYIVGLLVYIVPSLIATAVASGIFWVGMSILPEHEKLKDIGQTFGLLLSYATVYLICMLMLYVITAAVVNFCGRTLEASVFPLIVNALIPALILIICYILFDSFYCVDTASLLNSWLAPTSPIGLIIMTSTTTEAYLHCAAALSPSVLIPLAIILGLEITATYFLNKKRKSEQTGNAFVFPIAYHITLSALIFCITALFTKWVYSDPQNAGTAGALLIFVTFITFLLTEITTKRGFKKFGFACLRYAITVISSCLVIFWVCSTEGFGLGNYVPDANDVAYIETDIPEYLYENTVQKSDYYNATGAFVYRYTKQGGLTEYHSAEAINIIVERHKEYVEYRTSQEYVSPVTNYTYGDNSASATYNSGLVSKSGYFMNNITGTGVVVYHMKNGITVRRYIALEPMSVDEYKVFFSEGTYKQLIYDKIEKFIKDSGDKYTIGENLSPKPHYSAILQSDASDNTKSKAEAVKEILEAYRKDLEAETLEQFLYPDNTFANGTSTISMYNMSKEISINIEVKPHYTNLLALFEEESVPISEIYKIKSATLTGGGYITTKPTDLYSTGIVYPTELYELDLSDSEVIELINASHLNYATFDRGYTLHLETYSNPPQSQIDLVVPAEYYELAEKLMNKAAEKHGENRFMSEYQRIARLFTNNVYESVFYDEEKWDRIRNSNNAAIHELYNMVKGGNAVKYTDLVESDDGMSYLSLYIARDGDIRFSGVVIYCNYQYMLVKCDVEEFAKMIAGERQDLCSVLYYSTTEINDVFDAVQSRDYLY